ncbi:MAG: hypothetical protein K2K96_09415 [Lachnospiraceae bacterium]|nr:hypothetical protein [Lachnospiraceae bacterium]
MPEMKIQGEQGASGLRKIPENMNKKDAMAINQNKLAIERTELSKVRTDLSIYNSRLAVDQTHLSYLRTIVSLVGSAATVYKALPALGISASFSTTLAGFLMLFSVYFIYKDLATYPKMKKYLNELEKKTDELTYKTEQEVYEIED